MQRPPEITVAAIAENDGKFLTIEERVRGALVLNQPAGHLENNETLIEAVARECLEETAWNFRAEHLCAVYQWQHPHRDVNIVRFVFCGEAYDHDPTAELDDGIVRALWLTPQQIKDHQYRLRSPMVEQAIVDYLAGKRYPLEIVSEVENIYETAANWQFGS